MNDPNRSPWPTGVLALVVVLALTSLLLPGPPGADQAVARVEADYAKVAQPLLKKYCLGCHSTKAKKGSLDLERFASLDLVRKDLKPWQQTIEMLETDEMPPKGRPQPTAAERKQLISWVRNFLDAEARARSGDPGYIPLRRLSNAEYDYTIRDLTGVDLRPTREFPADGAGGEGFSNAAEALSDISPALLTKYLQSAKEIAQHAVLLPAGFRFSATKTRRDWTNESVEKLRAFYARYTADGRIPVRPYLAATVRYREVLAAKKQTVQDVAARENLNAKYLGVLWQTLTDKTPSAPLDQLRGKWQKATEKDVAALAAEIEQWQQQLWKFTPIGSYRFGNLVRQHANDPAAVETQTLRLGLKPAPGQSEVVLYLAAREVAESGKGVQVLWQRPRFERPGKPALLLRDYARFGPAYEIDYPSLFTGASKYLGAVAEAARNPRLSAEEIAQKRSLDAAFLKRWIEVVNLPGQKKASKTVPAVALEMLDEKTPKNDQKPVINGWRRKGAELPVVVTNSSNSAELIPGNVPPHGVAVHPTPQEFVAVNWASPVAGPVRLSARVSHAHPACGNGVAYWLEHRRANRATVLAEGTIDLGGQVKLPAQTLTVQKGDRLVLAVDARDGNHVCDLTQVALTVSETERPNRTWDLGADVADSIHAGNPHADRHGNKEVWSFVRGASKQAGQLPATVIPAGSVLARWRDVAVDPTRQREADKLALEVQTLLCKRASDKGKSPDGVLYDNLLSVESPLFKRLDTARLARPATKTRRMGLARERFGKVPGKPDEDASLLVAASSVTEVRLPAALFRDHVFVVEGKQYRPESAAKSDTLVGLQVRTTPPNSSAIWDGKSPVIGSAAGASYKKLLQGYAAFRRSFPAYVCFPAVVPTDEVVCLKMYHREDEPLLRLMLDDAARGQLELLWKEHRFISQQPVAENKYLPQFIGFVTQDQSKEMLAYYEGQRPVFRRRAEEFEREVEAAVPGQLEAMLEFADRAYRRPLLAKEKADLMALYQGIRKKGVTHDEAFRGVLTRILVSPAFLFRIERPAPGKEPAAVQDTELATRLSYFLWASMPDAELRKLAQGKLHEPEVLEGQVRRMLKDDRVRALAVEFGTQWVHVRGFDEFKEKNEKRFPSFDGDLRKAIYEESILFFQDLFQTDRNWTQILDADHTFVNETLARHYGIPGISGKQFRKVEGVKKYGRGGLLGLASVHARQSGSSRTSPVLRGNWVVETLLGEKLPRPPADVPQLPEEDGGSDGLSTRQLVEKHVNQPSCAVCHVRIDPLGFAFERYDPIGRWREKDRAGRAIDTRARLKDGTTFDGIDGLRTYLLTRKKDVVVRQFCQKLLGYALGRAVTLSDHALVDDMVAQLNKTGRLSGAILTIVQSKQFRSVRGSE